VHKIPVLGFCLAAASLAATPALSDSCPPQKQHVHQFIRTHYVHSSMRSTHVAYHRSYARGHYVMMEEPGYETYDEYYVAGPSYWRARSGGWWEWHPADDDTF